jgi:ParB/RepB/Spo0J family partition protein
VTGPTASEARIAVVELGDRFGQLRLCEAQQLAAMRHSLGRYGQLQPVVAFRDESRQLEVLDGLKRLRAARALGWPELWVSVADVSSVDAKVWLLELHQCHGLTELEEGWLVRSLHRDDGLSQGAIAQRLGRRKSWVCRRLLLVEGLEAAVQTDVRLGLLKPRAAVAPSLPPSWTGYAGEAVGCPFFGAEPRGFRFGLGLVTVGMTLAGSRPDSSHLASTACGPNPRQRASSV